jgi:hypothetical protein
MKPLSGGRGKSGTCWQNRVLDIIAHAVISLFLRQIANGNGDCRSQRSSVLRVLSCLRPGMHPCLVHCACYAVPHICDYGGCADNNRGAALLLREI